MTAFLSSFFTLLDTNPFAAAAIAVAFFGAALVIGVEALWGWRERRAEKKQRGLYLDFTGKTRIGIDKRRAR